MPANPDISVFNKKPKFPIGVWMPPVDSFDTWKARLCNTVMYTPRGHDVNNWSWQSVLKGLWQSRQPGNDPVTLPEAFRAEVAGTPNFLSVIFGDEPDLNHVAPATLLAAYQASKAVAPALDVFMNFSGGYVVGWQPNGPTDDDYHQYIAAADWIGNDVYPVTGWGRPDALDLVAATLDKMKQWTLKPRYGFIELSNQNLSWVPNDRGPTPAEVTVETFLSIVHGCRAVIYFPEQFGASFSFDATPAAVVAAITVNNQMITQYADYFADGIYTLLNTANPSVHAATWQLPRGTLKIAVNWTNQLQSALAAQFGALEVKILETANVPQPQPAPADVAEALQDSRLAAVEANLVTLNRWVTLVNNTFGNIVYPFLTKQGCTGLPVPRRVK